MQPCMNKMTEGIFKGDHIGYTGEYEEETRGCGIKYLVLGKKNVLLN